MTLRARKPRRSVGDLSHRRTLLLNIGFGGAIVLALLILAGAAAANYYDDHFASIATVDGQGISKDEFRDRLAVEQFRIDYAESQVRAQQDAGHITQTTASSQLSSLTNARQNMVADVADGLVESTLKGLLAARNGVAVTDQQVDQRLLEEATSPELRHGWVIEITAEVDKDAKAPTDAQKAAALEKATKALADITAGTISFEDYAKANSTAASGAGGGDVGWLRSTFRGPDQAFLDALFALPSPGLTDVIVGLDGVYRIGRVSEIAPQSVDAAYQQKIRDAGVSLDVYRRAVRSEVVAKALEEKIVADALDTTGPQRHVAEIFIAGSATGQSPGIGDEVKVRHILISPKHDAAGASSLPATDPAWAEAEAQAQKVHDEIVKDPSTFASVAKAQSDDGGSKDNGGDLGYYTKSALDTSFAEAVFKDGLKPDDILPIVKSAFGYHIIQFVDRRQQPQDRMAGIQLQAAVPGADFAALAKEKSEASSAANGGDIGWVAPLQLDSFLEAAIFKAPVGGISEMIQDPSGFHLYRIIEEQTRKPEGEQIATLKAKAFANWYAARKAETRIEKQYTVSNPPPAAP